MKKKLLSLLTVLLMVATGAVLLTACGNNDNRVNYVSASITLKADGWTQGYDCISEFSMQLGENNSFSNNFGFEDTIQMQSETVKANTVYTCTLTYKSGYNVSSVNVTEKRGNTSYKVRTGSEENGDEYKLYIDVTPTGGENYEFVLSRPTALIKQVGFADLSNTLLGSAAKPVKGFLDSAQIYIDGSFVSIKQLSGKYVGANMLDKYFYVYVKFDGDAKRVVFDDEFKKFVNLDGTYAAVTYEKLQNSSAYAYAFKFSTYGVNNQTVIKFDEGVIKNIGYRNADVDTLFSATVCKQEKWNYDIGENEVTLKGYRFRLNKVKTDNGEFESVSSAKFTKEYGKAYTFEYELTDAFITKNGNPLDSGEFFDGTNKADIKLTVNGKRVDTTYSHDGNDAPHLYRFTIDKDKLPVDFYDAIPENTDKFQIGVDITSVAPINGNTVSITTDLKIKSDPFFKLGDINTGDYSTVDSTVFAGIDGYSLYKVDTPCVSAVGFALPYSRFKVKVNVNGTDYSSPLLVRGTDYFAADAEFADSGYNIIKETTVEQKFISGTSIQDGKFILLKFENGMFYVEVYNGNERNTAIKIEVTDVQYQSAKVEFDSSLSGGKVILGEEGGEVVTDNVIVVNEYYSLTAPISNVDNYDKVYFEIYADGKLLGTFNRDDSAPNGSVFNASNELKEAVDFESPSYLNNDIWLIFNGSSGNDDGYIVTGYAKFFNSMWVEIGVGESGVRYYCIIDKIVVKL